MQTRLNLYRYHPATVARHNNGGEWDLDVFTTDATATNSYTLEPGRDYTKYTGVYDSEDAALAVAAEVTGLPIWKTDNQGSVSFVAATRPPRKRYGWVEVSKVA